MKQKMLTGTRCTSLSQTVAPGNGEALRTATTETLPGNGQAIILTNAALLVMPQVKHNQRALVRTDEAKWIRLKSETHQTDTISDYHASIAHGHV
jgi:hypothetical protein